MTKMSLSQTGIDRDAMVIYQSFLDNSDSALENDDFDAFTSALAFPHVIGQGDDVRMVEKPEHLRPVFVATRQLLATHNIRRRTRLCTDAHITENGALIGHHITWLVTTSYTIDQSYRVEIHLRKDPDLWRLTASHFTGPAHTLPGKMHQQYIAALNAHEASSDSGRDVRPSGQP